MDSENGILHDSGPVKARLLYRVPLKLIDRAKYRWSLTLNFDQDKVVKLDWIPLRVDLEAPTVLPLGPGDGEEISEPDVERSMRLLADKVMPAFK